MSKTYTLELTAEELAQVKVAIEPTAMPSSRVTPPLERKLQAAWEATRADREADELRLPWRITETVDPGWAVVGAGSCCRPKSERAAKLMSAAPELRDFAAYWYSYCSPQVPTPNNRGEELEKLHRRAMRKMETGVPEEG